MSGEEGHGNDPVNLPRQPTNKTTADDDWPITEWLTMPSQS